MTTPPTPPDAKAAGESNVTHLRPKGTADTPTPRPKRKGPRNTSETVHPNFLNAPKGRPKGTGYDTTFTTGRTSEDTKQAAFQREARKHAKKALAVVAQLMEAAKDERVRGQMAKLILDSAFGRPAQQTPSPEATEPIRLVAGDDAL